MSNNIQRLGDTLIKRMATTANAAVETFTELGIIEDNLSLTPDSLQVAIPQGGYLIAAGQKPQAGDRVLLAWCGNWPVVIAPALEEPQSIEVTVTHDGQGNVLIEF